MEKPWIITHGDFMEFFCKGKHAVVSTVANRVLIMKDDIERTRKIKHGHNFRKFADACSKIEQISSTPLQL